MPSSSPFLPLCAHNVALLSVRSLRNWDGADLRKVLPSRSRAFTFSRRSTGGSVSAQLSTRTLSSSVFGGEFAGSDVPSHVFPVALALVST